MVAAAENPGRVEKPIEQGNYISSPGPLLGKLNSLQTAMLQWNDMHPYNAIHVVRVPEILEVERVKSVVNATLEALRLTGLTLDRNAGTLRYSGGASFCEIKLLPSGENPLDLIRVEVEQQLNTPFAINQSFNPFRFFVASGPDFFFLGLTYFHAVADAESIVLLLKNVVETYVGSSKEGVTGPLALYPARWDRLLRYYPRALFKKLISMPALIRDMRSSYRPKYLDPMDLSIRFTFFSVSPQNLAFLISTAKSLEITLNDLFLALLMKSVSNLPAARTRAGRRKKISVGCIVNVRKDLEFNSERVFGLFLGSFVVTHEVPHGIRLEDLARAVGKQTRGFKKDNIYLAAPVELRLARFMLRWFSPERRKKQYQKNYPLWGGITNMNLNVLWPQRDGDKRFDYFRAVSTGPATPLVLSVTTVGGVANVGITYRQTVFSAEDIKILTDCFEDPEQQLGTPV